MRYIAEYVVTHLGNKHSGTLVLREERTPKVGDVLDVRIADFRCLFRLKV
jgi:hypothetical protein